MIDREDVVKAVGEVLGEGELFLVDVKMLAGDEIEIFIDSDGVREDGRPRGVSVEDCVKLTKAIETMFDREEEDFSLTVSSAGIGQPLKVARQFRKMIGRQVEVVLTNGTKLVATLEAAGIEAAGVTAGTADAAAGAAGSAAGVAGAAAGAAGAAAGAAAGDGSITLSYPEKQKIEGKKRPEIVTVTRTFPLAEVKTIREHIDFK
jgi:ribosome maturation factor RimP